MDDPRFEALTMFTAALERALAGARGQRERTIAAHRDHALIDACIAELEALITQTHRLIATARNLDIQERRSLGPYPAGDPTELSDTDMGVGEHRPEIRR